MFNLSGSEIVVILLLALVVLGPEKLPEAIRRAGRTYAELKRMGNSFQDEVRSVLDEPAKEMRETADLLRTTVNDTASTIKGAKPTPARRAATRPVTPPPQTAEPEPEPVVSDEELINRTLSGDSAPKPDEHPAP
jgi:sec-independent protein translocase protein TatB